MKPVTPQAAALTADQLRIAQWFAAMDARRQEEALVRMERIAATHPRRMKPALQLVVGGVA